MTDLKFAIRQLFKNPGFTAVAVCTLALGIGANTTIFSIINSILLKPVQVPHPEDLVGVYQHDQEAPDSFRMFSYPDFADLRSERDVAFQDLFAFHSSSVALQGELAKTVPARFVSANYFPALGVSPALGRVFLPEEETSGDTVAVLAHEFWTRLGADPSIIGKKLNLVHGEITVVGVMPRGFTGSLLVAPGMFLPIGALTTLPQNNGQAASKLLTDRGDREFMVMGRLKQGLALANMTTALAPWNKQFAIPDPALPKPRTLFCSSSPRFNFSSQPEHSSKSLAPVAGFASGLALLVLLIACLNLANMMLARGAARRKEIAVRLALGANQGRILRQLATEGALLAGLGAGASLIVSGWATHLLSAFIYSGAGMPADFPKFDLSPDARVFLALLLLGVISTLVFALWPAWQLVRSEVNSDLKSQAGGGGSSILRQRFGLREILAIGQIAAALSLLVAATLFTRSAMKIVDANPGFEFGSNFYINLETTLAEYPKPRAHELILAANDRLSALSGIESSSVATTIPFGNSWDVRGVQIGGAPQPSNPSSSLADGAEIQAIYNVVGAGYFHTLGLPVLRGREFERREVESATAPAAIISQDLAEALWPGQEALGRTVQFAGANPTLMTVVGVVPSMPWGIIQKEAKPQIYVPLSQDFPGNVHLHVRVAPAANPPQVMSAAIEELRRLDPRMPLTEIKTLRAMHQDGPSVRVARLGSGLFCAFGGLALVLSSLGIYGLRSYAVARRTREIGIRMALGANQRNVVGMILREGALLALAGLGTGLALALLVGKLAGKFLYAIPALDPLTFIVVPLFLFAVTLLACAVPAHRASRVNPMAALRNE